MKKKITKVQTLLDALPYIKKYNNKIFVVKYGGSAQTDNTLKEKFAQDIILLSLIGIKVVIVHGGGNKISYFLDKLNIDTKFIDGLRVTNKESMEIVEMVLSGNINKEITSMINHHGGKAIGINGKDADFLKAEPINKEKYGYVGKITQIKTEVLLNLINEGFIPVIAPIATGENNESFNINADLAASKIAGSLKAEKVIFLTDIDGVMDKEKNLLSTLSKEEIEKLKKDGTISGGMIPKVDACLEAIEHGVNKAHIINGKIEHSILLEILTSEGIGTVIKN